MLAACVFPASAMKYAAALKAPTPSLRRALLGAVTLLGVTAYLWLTQPWQRRPPNYHSWYTEELALPQNDVNLVQTQGARYVLFSNHLHTIGWGNVMQDLLINAHIAYEAQWTFVTYNYSWNTKFYSKQAYYGNSMIPNHIPLTAYAAGPIAGDPFPNDAWRPPAVSTPFFRAVCPNPTRFNVDELKGEVALSSGGTIIDHFVNKLRSTDDNCVEFEKDSGSIFFWPEFSDGPRVSDMFSRFLESPIVTHWLWSSLVTSALNVNRALIHPGIRYSHAQDAVLPGLLALHVRRGDFEGHCKHLGKMQMPYQSFNTLPGFPDQYMAPNSGEHSGFEPENAAFYDKHCFPKLNYVVEKVAQVRADAVAQGRALDRIYVLTNGRPDWFAKLQVALDELGGWKAIHYSRELSLTHEQRYIAQAVDMLIATRAEVFVGNAWSSLTSNVNVLRAAQHRSPETSRFW